MVTSKRSHPKKHPPKPRTRKATSVCCGTWRHDCGIEEGILLAIEIWVCLYGTLRMVSIFVFGALSTRRPADVVPLIIEADDRKVWTDLKAASLSTSIGKRVIRR